MSLELLGVSAAYGETVVLRDVDLVVPSGTVCALVGANGAGKTSLLRAASGLLPFRSGAIRLDGEDISHVAPFERRARGLCHIPEGRGVFPNLSVRDNLRAFAKRDVDLACERAAEVFPVLGRRSAQLAGTLSGGEQQMLALARAYVTDPDYVLLDEVSMGLAPRIVEEIFEFLTHLASLGCALLVVEQYVQRALAMADFAYVLRKGEVVFAGEPGEIDADRLSAEYLGATA
jgi:branched-chain amino acid transport system ATP-binding protein